MKLFKFLLLVGIVGVIGYVLSKKKGLEVLNDPPRLKSEQPS